MKELLLSNCEKNFIQNSICDSVRLDGRSLDEHRALTINFGVDYGSVHVKLGKTRVLAQVTCEVVEPKSTRPNEGLLFINVEVGAMAAPNFESNRQSDTSVQINRILERALKDSRCIDLESLCIVSEEKVWNLRVDLNVLNHEGNIIDCASAAALAALAHFRRPDVSTSGEEVIIHSFQEKDPIPIVLHHYPVCVSYAIFNKGKIAVADPTCLEERVAEASLVFGINSYRELCGLHLGGTTLTSADLLLRSTTSAAKRAKLIVDLIKSSLAADEERRARGEVVDFSKCIELDKLASYSVENLPIQLKRFQNGQKGKNNVDEGHDDATKMEGVSDAEEEREEDDKNVFVFGKQTGVLFNEGSTKWVPDQSSGDSDDSNESEAETKPQKKLKKTITQDSNSESEEEKVVMLSSVEKSCKKPKKTNKK